MALDFFGKLVDMLGEAVEARVEKVGETFEQVDKGADLIASIDTRDPDKALANAINSILLNLIDKNIDQEKFEASIQARKPKGTGVLFKKQGYTLLSTVLPVPDLSPTLKKNLDTMQILYDRLAALEQRNAEYHKKYGENTHDGLLESQIAAMKYFLNTYIDACKIGNIKTYDNTVDLVEVYKDARLNALQHADELWQQAEKLKRTKPEETWKLEGEARKALQFLEGTTFVSSQLGGEALGKHSQFHNMLKEIAKIHGMDFKTLETQITQEREVPDDDMRKRRIARARR